MSEGGLEPPRPIRTLGPQPSASANSATPTRAPGVYVPGGSGQQPGESDRGDGERQPHDHRQAIEIPLGERRPAQRRGAHPSAEHVGQTAAPPGVEQDQPDQSERDDDVKDDDDGK